MGNNLMYEQKVLAVNTRFTHAPLKQPSVLITVAKSGSHLLRNVLCMFIPASQQRYHHEDSLTNGGKGTLTTPIFIWGHIPITPTAANALQVARKILLVRDPYDWVLAMARYVTTNLISLARNTNEYHINDDIYERKGITLGELFNILIIGMDIRNRHPSIRTAYIPVAVGWKNLGVHLVKYEELCKHINDLRNAVDTEDTKQYFREILGAFNIEMPDDWKERVLVGSDTNLSVTARENVGVNYDIPDVLPDEFKKLVDFTVPNLREYLGYE